MSEQHYKDKNPQINQFSGTDLSGAFQGREWIRAESCFHEGLPKSTKEGTSSSLYPEG